MSVIDSVWRAEVTLDCLEGLLRIGKNDDLLAPSLNACVTFSGSVPTMRVPSCSVCLQTGQLMIESEGLSRDESKSDGIPWLEAKFKSDRPHLTVPLLQRDQAFIRPTSNLSENTAMTDEFIVTHNKRAVTGARGLLRPLTIRRGPSAVWSDHCVLPDIVELSVRLSYPEAPAGVAHLVFSDEMESGSCKMELPIKLKTDESEELLAPLATFTYKSRLRLRVNILPPKVALVSPIATTVSAAPPSLQSSSSNSESSDSVLKLTHSQLINELVPIMDTIKQNEKQAREQRQAQKRAMDVEIDNLTHRRGVDGIGASIGDLCATFSWTGLMQNLVTVVRRCNTIDQASVGSSICTNASWEVHEGPMGM